MVLIKNPIEGNAYSEDRFLKDARTSNILIGFVMDTTENVDILGNN